MRKTSRKLLILSLVVLGALAGCTLVAEVDRGDIPPPGGEGGAGGAGGAEN